MSKVVLKVGDDVSTDIIYPGRYMATVLPTETPQFAFADDAQFNKKLKAGEIPHSSFIVAGENFGCGSSREQAASCLRGWEVVIVAKHFARIFLQNAINLGLQMVICPDIESDEGDELEVKGNVIVNVSKGKEFKVTPLPAARQAIID
ncbi:MAG: 3-isopropylmalate dehydratase, partial [Candidatus Zixiibacteriota bacterium]